MSGKTTTESDHAWTWPSELFEDRVAAIAAKIGLLIADERRWVDRRVETLTFVDETTVARQTSVHFSAPNLGPAVFEMSNVALSYVPVAMLKKAVLKNFNVRDRDGRPLPMLTRRQNARLSAVLLQQQAEGTLGEDLCWEVKATLAELAGVDEYEPPEKNVKGKPIRTDEAQVNRQSQALADDDEMLGLISDLERNFLMIVPYVVRAGTADIIEFSYEIDFGPSFADAEGSTVRRLIQPVLNFLQAFGLLDFRTGYETPAVFDAQSYHIEIAAPDSLIVSEAVLYREELVRESGPKPRSLGSRVKGLGARFKDNRVVADEAHVADASPSPVRMKIHREPLTRDWATDRAHLYYSHQTPRPMNTSGARVDVKFSLRTALVLPVFLLSVVTTLTLAGGLFAHYHYAISRSGDTAAAIIVALPTFFAPAVAPGGHRLVQRMFKGMRALVFASAMVSFAAGASLSVRLSTDTRVTLWWVLLATSAGITAIVALSFGHSWWKTSKLATIRSRLAALLAVDIAAVAALAATEAKTSAVPENLFLYAVIAAAVTAVTAVVGLARAGQKQNRRHHPGRV